MTIAESPTRNAYPLSYKKVMKKTLASGLLLSVLIGFFYLLFGIGLLTQAGIDFGTYLVLFLLGMGLLVIVINVPIYFYQRWYFATYYYDFNADYIVIRKGPITPREITIPYERIQDVYVDQDLLDRLLGLYDVHLSSATISSGMAAHIDGVEKAAADGLRTVLLQTVSERISKNRRSN